MEDSETDMDMQVVEELCPDSLYIMTNSCVAGQVKIGRSHQPEQRAKQLCAGSNNHILVMRTYGGKGFLEKTIHNKLRTRRVEGIPGIEWFWLSVEQASLLIEATILEDELAKTSR